MLFKGGRVIYIIIFTDDAVSVEKVSEPTSRC